MPRGERGLFRDEHGRIIPTDPSHDEEYRLGTSDNPKSGWSEEGYVKTTDLPFRGSRNNPEAVAIRKENKDGRPLTQTPRTPTRRGRRGGFKDNILSHHAKQEEIEEFFDSPLSETYLKKNRQADVSQGPTNIQVGGTSVQKSIERIAGETGMAYLKKDTAGSKGGGRRRHGKDGVRFPRPKEGTIKYSALTPEELLLRSRKMQRQTNPGGSFRRGKAVSAGHGEQMLELVHKHQYASEPELADLMEGKISGLSEKIRQSGIHHIPFDDVCTSDYLATAGMTSVEQAVARERFIVMKRYASQQVRIGYTHEREQFPEVKTVNDLIKEFFGIIHKFYTDNAEKFKQTEEEPSAHDFSSFISPDHQVVKFLRYMLVTHILAYGTSIQKAQKFANKSEFDRVISSLTDSLEKVIERFGTETPRDKQGDNRIQAYNTATKLGNLVYLLYGIRPREDMPDSQWSAVA
jgi:hypothetical protein